MITGAIRPGPPELWGGIECTVNRTGDTYRDQIRLNGHETRLGDLDLFADLGLKALRYPILWERTMPQPGGAPDWRWADERLYRLRALKIRPIAGLVHHGSGPRHTHLLDPGFATGLGRFAGAVAARYPWIEDWTPVNEPLTTARFSALYGHWYPHRRDARCFWLALLNQVDATRAAMRAIRRINPAARLIATDDLGHTHATPPLAEQAAFDNARRWAGWDLLFGRVATSDPVGEELERLGLGDRLRRIADDPCPPDLIGVNHYLTSDRFLDHRMERYPGHLHGGNGCARYADTEAVRVLDPPVDGLRRALVEAWGRYRTPLAITEVHLGCTREEQLRWATAAWDTAADLRLTGVDVRAVTAWSLLGSYGWNTLLTSDGAYEPGVFDVTTGEPRPTALATLWRALAAGAPRHLVTAQPGWWQRADRLLYAALPSGQGAVTPDAAGPASPLLILGADTSLGRAVVDACEMRGLRHVSAHADPACSDVALLPARSGAWGLVDARGDACDPHAAAVMAGCRLLDLPCLIFLSCDSIADDMPVCGGRDAAVRSSARQQLRETGPITGEKGDLPAGDGLDDRRARIDRLLDRLIDGESGIVRF